MHPSMFNHLPDPEKVLRGCFVVTGGLIVVAFVIGGFVGWLLFS